MGRVRGAHASLGILCAAGVLTLTACGGSDSDSSLSEFTGSASTTSSTSATGTASPTTSGADASGAGDAAVDTKVSLAAGLTGDAAAAGTAYGAFWTFVGTTLSAPPMDVAAAGEFVSGEELNDLAAGAERRASDQLRTTGTQTVAIRSVAVAGAQATVCATVLDATANIGADGKVVDPPSLQTRTYKATLKKEGPSWRTYDSEQVKAC